MSLTRTPRIASCHAASVPARPPPITVTVSVEELEALRSDTQLPCTAVVACSVTPGSGSLVPTCPIPSVVEAHHQPLGLEGAYPAGHGYDVEPEGTGHVVRPQVICAQRR